MKFKNKLVIWKLVWQHLRKVNIRCSKSWYFRWLEHRQEKCRQLCAETQDTNARSSPLCNSPKPETSQILKNWTIDGPIVEYSHNGILDSRENEQLQLLITQLGQLSWI